MPRKNQQLTGLSAVVAAALLLLSFLPLALCHQAGPCPMRTARQDATTAAPCVPGPTFDCCKGDDAPPSRGSGDLLAQQLPGLPVATAAVSSTAVPPLAARAARAGSGAGAPARAIPLFTLHATLLI